MVAALTALNGQTVDGSIGSAGQKDGSRGVSAMSTSYYI